jgi:hypothetical protein
MKIKKEKLRKMIEEAHRAAQGSCPGDVNYDEAEDYADKIIAGLKKQKQPDEWPKIGDKYWFLNCYGIWSAKWCGDDIDQKRQKRGIYKTKSEAQYRDGVRLLNEYLRSMNKGYEFVVGGSNFYIEYNIYNPNTVYFASAEDRQKAIDNMSEELKKFMKPM